MMRIDKLLLVFILVQPVAAGLAQDKLHGKTGANKVGHKPAHQPVRQPVRKAAHKPAAPESGAGQPTAAAPSVAESKPVATEKPGTGPRVESDATESVKKEGGSEVKVLQFSGLDIEGQLKTPQMLYFLNRLRAEFDRPRLPHRSFLPELQRSTQEKSF